MIKCRLQSTELTVLLQLVVVLCHHWQCSGVKLSVLLSVHCHLLVSGLATFGQLVTEHWNNAYFRRCFYHIRVLPSMYRDDAVHSYDKIHSDSFSFICSAVLTQASCWHRLFSIIFIHTDLMLVWKCKKCIQCHLHD